MKLPVNNKPASTADKEKDREKKQLKKQFGDYDLKSIMKYVRKLEKRVEALEKK